jgi:hypothetical protein
MVTGSAPKISGAQRFAIIERLYHEIWTCPKVGGYERQTKGASIKSIS